MAASLDLLRFAALSSAVHADALQCLADDTRRALSQRTADAARLRALEEKLSRLTERQKRFEEMRSAVRRARRSRGAAEAPAAVDEAKGKKVESTKREKSRVAHAGNVLRFAASAVEGDELGAPWSREKSLGVKEKDNAKTQRKKRDKKFGKDVPMLHRNDEEKNSESGEEVLTEESIDEEVERVKAEIVELESMSIQTKLRTLESLKQEVKDIDADAIFGSVVTPFSFSSDVEDLWASGERMPSKYEHINVINSANIDLFTTRACEHFSQRYEEAFAAIEEFTLSGESDPVRVFGSLQYAEAMTDARNYDVTAVQKLQGARQDFLINFYKTMRNAATVSVKNTSCDTDSVLGDDEFCVLPADWQSSQVMSVPSSTLLPPVRHILSPRFTFADASELKSLQTLRVDFQRELIARFMGMGEALSEMERLASSQEDEVERRDSSAALVRVLADDATSNVVWTTLAQSPLH